MYMDVLYDLILPIRVIEIREYNIYCLIASTQTRTSLLYANIQVVQAANTSPKFSLKSIL